MGDLRAGDLLRRDVCLNGIRLGVPVDVLLEPDRLRVVGLDVVCGDHNHRFLPLAAFDLVEGHIVVTSALTLLADELRFYRERGRSLGELRGSMVRREGRPLGAVADLTFGADGDVHGLVLRSGDGEREVPLDPAVVVGAHDGV
jgi:hypothetical protein